MKPLCFVIMPFNIKKDADGNEIDFNDIYHSFIYKAIDEAGMEPIRADEETVDGIIHKPMYERLILCDYAVADLSTSNANVLYELGIRHAVKPYTTINVYAEGSKLPFDVNGVRCMPYHYDYKTGLTKVAKDIEALAKKLKHAKLNKDMDSPVYQLVEGISFQNSVAHEKTDVFRKQVTYNKEMKNLLADIRAQEDIDDAARIQLIDEVVATKIDFENEEAGVLVDIMLSYRSASAFKKMIAFIESMPAHVKNTVMVQEQLGFALNRDKRSTEAVRVLESVLDKNGPSSETYGILGRIYKDKFDKASAENDKIAAQGFLNQAIENYQKGFEADWRDAYPGINLLMLLAIKGENKKVADLSPVVSYSVQRKLQHKKPDYWDYATLVEIAVITDDKEEAEASLSKALTAPIKESWMLQTTMDSLQRLSKIRQGRGENIDLIDQVHAEFKNKYDRMTKEKP